jgi:acetyl-CoA C-acetyltransferase
MSDVFIVGAARTPIGHMGGYFKNVSAVQLGGVAIKAAISRANISPALINEVYMGCVLPAGLGQAPARQAALYSGIGVKTPCTTINKMCGSGLKTIMLGYDAINAGNSDIIAAGGMENMTRAPYLLLNGRYGYRLGHQKIFDHMMLDGLEDAYEPGKAMGVFAELCAEKFNFTRKEQDEFALHSLEKSKNASENGLFQAEIAPVEVAEKSQTILVEKDEGPLTVKPEKIVALKPAFKKDGTVTAANSSSISDGGAAVILMNQESLEKHSVKALAKIVGHYTHAQEPDWFTTAPIGAITGLLSKIKWSLDDVDLFEINEAFAVVPMVTIQELNIPAEKVNINGGACVLGHPIGASGARILVTLLYALQQRHKKRGIATLCLGGGEAVAVAIELL